MCSHGYVVMRVDMRGSGNSTGLYFDEYAQQEQDDACEVIGKLTSLSLVWEFGCRQKSTPKGDLRAI